MSNTESKPWDWRAEYKNISLEWDLTQAQGEAFLDILQKVAEYERAEGEKYGRTTGMHEIVFCMHKLSEAHENCGCLYTDAVRDMHKAMLSTNLPIDPEHHEK